MKNATSTEERCSQPVLPRPFWGLLRLRCTLPKGHLFSDHTWQWERA